MPRLCNTACQAVCVIINKLLDFFPPTESIKETSGAALSQLIDLFI